VSFAMIMSSHYDPFLGTPVPLADVTYDPIEEYGIPEHRELVRFYEKWYQTTQANWNR